jgi:ankyrin repeat protein
MKNRLHAFIVLIALSALLDGCGLFISSHHRTEDYTPVFADATAGNVEAVKAALKNDPSLIKATGWENTTLLHTAIEQNHYELAQMLLDDGADVNATTTDRLTPLHMAGQNGNTNIVNLLIDRNAKINAVDSEGWTPLDRAMKWGHPEAVDLLRRLGGRSAIGLR